MSRNEKDAGITPAPPAQITTWSGVLLFGSHLLRLYGPYPLPNLFRVVLDHRRALTGNRCNEIIAAARLQKLTAAL